MSEQTQEVRPVEVHYLCDACGIGQMQLLKNSMALLTYPAKYQHQCSHCGVKQLFTTTYPAIRWERLTAHT